jgi:hypothetical protein
MENKTPNKCEDACRRAKELSAHGTPYYVFQHGPGEFSVGNFLATKKGVFIGKFENGKSVNLTVAEKSALLPFPEEKPDYEGERRAEQRFEDFYGGFSD